MKNSSILVFKLGAIGDVVLMLPMLHALRARFPDAKITLLIGCAAAPLVQEDPAIDEVWIVNENDFWKKRPFALWKLFWAIRQKQFQSVYILQWSVLFHFFFWLMAIPQRIGFSREGKAFRLTRRVPYFEGDAAHHDVDLYLQLIGPDAPLNGRPKIVLTQDERNKAETTWLSLGVSNNLDRIVVAPGGGHNAKLVMPLKRWPIIHFSSLVKQLQSEGASVALLGSAEEHLLLSAIGLTDDRNFAGKLSLRESAALIATASLFIGNDSGLTHIASAVDTPSVAFFGPTSPHGKTARGVPQKVLYRQEMCSPCYRFGQAPPCPYAVKCLTQISVEDALNAVHDLQRVAHA